MPAKRKHPRAATAAPPIPGSLRRRSALAKEHNITADQESDIRSAFDLFASQPSPDHDSHDDAPPHDQPLLASADLRRALIALDTPPTDADELRELLEVVDPEGDGWVSFDRFIAVAALKSHQKADQASDEDEDGDGGVVSQRRRREEQRQSDIRAAHRLFTGGQDRGINLADLRRVARELKEEDVADAVLKDMIREATEGGVGPVGLEDFEGVMKRAGVFS